MEQNIFRKIHFKIKFLFKYFVLSCKKIYNIRTNKIQLYMI